MRRQDGGATAYRMLKVQVALAASVVLRKGDVNEVGQANLFSYCVTECPSNHDVGVEGTSGSCCICCLEER
jgi:hypothetical protein